MIGGVGFLAILCASIAFYRSYKYKNATYLPKTSGPGGSAPGSGSQQQSRPFGSSKNGGRSTNGDKSLAGITIASTQVSGGPHTAPTRMHAGHQANTVDEFGKSLGDEDESRENSSAHMVLSGATAYGIPSRKSSLKMQARTEYPRAPQQPSITTILPLKPSPAVSPTDDSLSDRWDSPSIAHGAPTIDEKPTELGDVLIQSQADAPRDGPGREREHEHESEHVWSAQPHPYAHPLAAVNPAPLPSRPGSARGPSSPVRTTSPGISARAGAGTGAHSGADGDQPVSAEYAFGSLRGLSMRARVEGAASALGSGSGGNRSRSRENGNERGTEYVRHTDAGAVRVVELPPLYNELQR